MSYRSKLSGVELYRIDKSITKHFTHDSYNFFIDKIQAVPKSTYDRLNDKMLYERLASQYLRGDLIFYCMSNQLAGKTHISGYDYDTFYAWKSRMQRMTYVFDQDMKTIMSHGLRINDMFESSNGGLPIGIQLLNGGMISLETVCCLDILTNGALIEKLERKVTDKFLWPSIHRKIVKYKSWLRVNIEDLKPILKQYL